MAVVINGSGTVTGLAVGGLPDGIVDAGTLATNSVDSAELVDGSIDNSHLADDAVDSDEIAAGAIDAAHLASGVGGKVLQVLQSGITNDPSTTSSSYVDTGLQVDITPSSTSSKVLIILVGHGIKYTGTNANSINTRIERDGTLIVQNTGIFWSNSNTYHTGGISMSELDSPATTNQVTYKFRFATTNSGYTVSLRGNDTSMIAMEIAA